jgi:hypothetical protein
LGSSKYVGNRNLLLCLTNYETGFYLYTGIPDKNKNRLELAHQAPPKGLRH